MDSDPIVDDIRKAREDHAKKFGYDLSAICVDLKEREENSGHLIVSYRPRLFSKRIRS